MSPPAFFPSFPSSQGLDYWWVETARVQAESFVTTLSWNNEGNRLLTAGEYIQLWYNKASDRGEGEKQRQVEHSSIF